MADIGRSCQTAAASCLYHRMRAVLGFVRHLCRAIQEAAPFLDVANEHAYEADRTDWVSLLRWGFRARRGRIKYSTVHLKDEV